MSKMNVTLFLIAGTTLAVLHVLAVELFLYWRFQWIDTPMHALGGSVVALGLFAGNAMGWWVPKRWLQFVPVMLIVLAVALGWEVFGLYAEAPMGANYVSDTLTDLAAGLVGGVIGYFVGSKINSL